MEFYLLNNYNLEEAYFNLSTPKIIKLNLQDDPTHCGGDVTRFEKFKKAFDRQVAAVQRSMSIELRPVEKTTGKGETDPASNLWSVTLNSEVLKTLHQLLHCGSLNVALQIELQLTFQTYIGASKWQDAAPLVIEDFLPLQHEPPKLDQTCSWRKLVSVKVPPKTYMNMQKLSIKIDGSDFVDLANIPVPCSDVNRKIYTEKEFCDFEIVSEDGTAIPCHKIFLCAKSSVFSQMLREKKFRKARENKMTVGDMSTRGINAMLEYLYCGDFNETLIHSDVAFELLKAADKYDIPDLWAVMAKILEEKCAAWYDVDVALKLTSFVVNCQRLDSELLGKKAIKAVALKSEQLAYSAVYHELFPTPMLRGMFKMSLEAAKKTEENS